VKFGCLTREECGLCPIFACYTPVFALQLRKEARKNLSQGSRKVSVGHDSMYRHGCLLRVARTICQSWSPCCRGYG